MDTAQNITDKAAKVRCPLPDIASTKSKPGSVVIEGIRGHHQLERFSCGPAAVATVFRAYAGALDHEVWATIAAATEAKPGGTPPGRVCAALAELGIGHSVGWNEFGFDALYPMLRAGDLIITTLPMPRHVGSSRTHWVVICGASPSGVMVLNHTRIPFFTKRWISWGEVARRRDDPEEEEEMIRCKTGLTGWVADGTACVRSTLGDAR